MTVGLLLAGGKARRMGSDKRQLRLGGQTLLERNLAFLQELFPTVAVSLRQGQGVELPLGSLAEVIVDHYEGSPLAGIATALERFAAPLFVLAVDIAFPDAGAVADLLEAFRGTDVAVPLVDDKLEPLHAVYGPRCLPPCGGSSTTDDTASSTCSPTCASSRCPSPRRSRSGT